HIIQSLGAIAGAGPFGRGLGHGLQKFGYLPEDTTDFLFAIVCEELGLAGAAMVCFIYAALINSLVAVARRETSVALRTLVVGVTATIGLQAAINLLVVTGLAPTKGIALPLMSAGGTGWILTAGAIGLVVSIDRSQARADESPRAALGVA
ncbi:MAG: FtsW/RodA/SpoVE family cell cycle protein, partial [Planctomycetota bacterium]